MFNPYNIPIYNPNQQFNFQMYQPLKIPRVNGEESARKYNMPNSSEVLLLDTEEPIVWLVQTDDAGGRTVDPLPIVLPVSEEKKAMDTLEERVRKLEEAMKRESRAVDVAYTEEPN